MNIFNKTIDVDHVEVIVVDEKWWLSHVTKTFSNWSIKLAINCVLQNRGPLTFFNYAKLSFWLKPILLQC